MVLLQVVVFLMMCAVALGWVARHFRFPYPIALVIGGAALGFVPRLPQLEFDPQFLLVLVLPPILYQAALLTSWHEFKANIRPRPPPPPPHAPHPPQCRAPLCCAWGGRAPPPT